MFLVVCALENAWAIMQESYLGKLARLSPFRLGSVEYRPMQPTAQAAGAIEGTIR